MTNRNSSYSIQRAFLDRWSPRAFDSSTMEERELMTILEAGRWAPSAYNYQPWRFLFSLREDAHWDLFLSLLIPFNVSWASRASGLVFIASDELMRSGKGDTPSYSHSFDAGAAWAFMALQAQSMGFVTHGMIGLEFDRLPAELNLPDGFRIEAAMAVGRQGDAGLLPEGLRERESPSDRKPLTDLVSNGPLDGKRA